jgi:hypothetical protein
METVYDWITVAVYAVLVTRFLSQSARAEGSDDSLWHYLVPSAGCALANWLGNEGWDLAAVALIAAILFYIYRFIWPAQRPPASH